jgi:transposase
VASEISPPINAKERQMEMESSKDVRTEGELPEPRLGQPAAAVSTTVDGFIPDTEECLVDQQRWEEIHARRGAGVAIAQIAREFELDRKTVRSVLSQRQWHPYRRRIRRSSLMDAHRAWLEQRAAQVNYSARILYQELRSKRGYTGCYENVKLAVRPLRQAATVASLTQCRFETAPGEQAQVDWGEVRVRLGGERVRVHVFVMTLGYSRRGYAEGFTNERLGNVLAAHERAFAHFGGRCETILYDNMRTVAVPTQGQPKKLNATFAAFAGHWSFTPRLCQPYRAQTKGKVESGVKYVKRNFVPGRVFRDLEDFNAQLAAWQAEVADVRIHGTTHQRPAKRRARWCPPRARRASCRRWCASAWWPTTGWWRSTATATRCPLR